MFDQLILLFNMTLAGDFMVRQEVDKNSNYPIVNVCKMKEAYQVCMETISDANPDRVCKKSSYEYVETLSLIERKSRRDYHPDCYKSVK